MILDLDTSARIKRYVYETGSVEVREWLRSAQDKTTVLITRAEFSAAINRLLHLKFLLREETILALDEFRGDWRNLPRLAISEALVARADALARLRHLCDYDAIHLAADLNWQGRLDLPVTVVKYDRELSTAARAGCLELLPEDL
jgi:predicted nucleic acid-binding protein